MRCSSVGAAACVVVAIGNSSAPWLGRAIFVQRGLGGKTGAYEHDGKGLAEACFAKSAAGRFGHVCEVGSCARAGAQIRAESARHVTSASVDAACGEFGGTATQRAHTPPSTPHASVRRQCSTSTVRCGGTPSGIGAILLAPLEGANAHSWSRWLGDMHSRTACQCRHRHIPHAPMPYLQSQLACLRTPRRVGFL